MELEIIYQDSYLVAINKPHGLLVHRSSIAADVDIFALQLLRDQIGMHVYPIHRLDRKTSGVLLFALTSDVAAEMQRLFVNHSIKKEYCAIVRGWMPNETDLLYAIKNERGNSRDAHTLFKNIEHSEIELPFGKHATSRYSLISAFPKTGRWHQIRQHLAHLRHPIIADRPHGCNKQNKLFKEKWNMDTMMLHALSVQFTHPVTHKFLFVKADLSKEFLRTMQLLNLKESI